MNDCSIRIFNYVVTIMNHNSGNNQGVGMVHKITLPKNQPQFSQMMMGKYW